MGGGLAGFEDFGLFPVGGNARGGRERLAGSEGLTRTERLVLTEGWGRKFIIKGGWGHGSTHEWIPTEGTKPAFVRTSARRRWKSAETAGVGERGPAQMAAVAHQESDGLESVGSDFG